VIPALGTRLNALGALQQQGIEADAEPAQRRHHAAHSAAREQTKTPRSRSGGMCSISFGDT
jgi:hypothetical protein